MANLIQIKRSITTEAPPSLANGEIAFSGNTNSQSLFIGNPNGGAVERIGGMQYDFLHQAGSPGTLTANATPIVDGNTFIDQLNTSNFRIQTSSGSPTEPNINEIKDDDANWASVTNTQLVTAWAIVEYVDAQLGTQTQAFNTFSVAGQSDVVADSTTDTMTYVISNGTIITTDAGTDTITFGLQQQLNTAASPTFGGITITGTASFESGVDLGNASDDLISIAGSVDTAIIPSTNNTLDIGSTTNRWDQVYAANIEADSINATDIVATGNLIVQGTLTTIDTNNLVVDDPLIKLARNNNLTDVVDIGLYGLYDDSGSQDEFAGLFRDATDQKWRLFDSLQVEPTTTVDTGGAGYAIATLVAGIESSSATITGGTITGITDLVVADGGTGVSTFTTNGILYGNGTGAIQATAAGADGTVLTSVSGTPTWANIDGGSY